MFVPEASSFVLTLSKAVSATPAAVCKPVSSWFILAADIGVPFCVIAPGFATNVTSEAVSPLFV
jgi:hypothetical protein